MSEFLIMFREVLEGVLVVGILYTFIIKTGRKHLEKSIINGVIASLAATGIFAVIFQVTYGGFEGREAALFEGTTMIIAAILLSTMIVWMARNKNVAESLEKEASQIIERDKNVALGLFALTFFAIFREGVEVVLFLYAIVFNNPGGLSISGAVLGTIVSLMIGYAIFVQGQRVPLKQFFNITSILLIFVCAGLVAYGVHEFEEAFYTKEEMKQMEIWNINDKGPIFGFNIDDNGNARPLFSDKGAVGQIFKGFFGYNGNPSSNEMIAYLLTLGLVSFLWTRASQIPAGIVKDEKSPMNEKCPTCFEEIKPTKQATCSNCDTELST
ncbi:MAG: FTR1 family protein [Candidatus Neomarinimicrobiota bacterium]|nr:FTR1 family protein [Candidatus Neomarinimicrobiota bacterium]